MPFNIALVEPEIPQNTGNIARLCAATGTKLHLVKPLGFEIDDRKLKRAGLDYWYLLDITYYDNLQSFLELNNGRPMFFSSTKAAQTHSDIAYPEDCFLVFGKETKGLPEDLLRDNYENCIRIPMISEARSLNLSNSAAVVLYEALRQHNYSDLCTEGHIPIRI